jgi:hypothetical protein
MAAEEPPALRTRRNVNGARETLARAFKVDPDKVAERFRLDEESFAEAVRSAISATLDQRGPFLFHWARVLDRRDQEVEERLLQRVTTTLPDARTAFRRWPEIRGALESDPGLRRALETELSRVASEVTPVPDHTDNTTALGREVSGLDAKVNILLGPAGTLLVGLIAGAIALWQAIGGVETRLTRELGQVETRITQQIADVRSEVGEIRGRLSAVGQAPVPPPR